MNWVLMLVIAMLVLTSLLFWQAKRKRLKKRVWRQVQVTKLVKIKQHKAGPIEILGEPSLLVEFMFMGESYACQTAYREQLTRSFQSNEATFILIDPDHPTQCYYNACQQSKYVKLWFMMSCAIAMCFFAVQVLPKI